MKRAAAVISVGKQDVLDQWADAIRSAMQHTVEGIFETGRVLCEAKAALPHGSWMRLFSDGRVPLSVGTADRFMAVWKAKPRLIANSAHALNLPPSWMTLYELQALPEDTLSWAISEGKVTPELERKEVKALLTAYTKATAPPPPPPRDDWPSDSVDEQEDDEPEGPPDIDAEYEADTGLPLPPPKLGAPSNGMQFARIAIMKLEEIRDDDLERDQAFTHVRRWLDARQAQTAMHS